jgi:hypothetical protein
MEVALLPSFVAPAVDIADSAELSFFVLALLRTFLICLTNSSTCWSARCPAFTYRGEEKKKQDHKCIELGLSFESSSSYTIPSPPLILFRMAQVSLFFRRLYI